MIAPPAGYCFCILGRRQGPWRATEVEARRDALAAGQASLDECSDTIYLDACAEIWVTHADVVVEPRTDSVAQAPRPYPPRIGRIIARREATEAA